MTQSSGGMADIGPLTGMIVFGLGVGLLVTSLTGSFNALFLIGFFAGMPIILGTYLTLHRRIGEA